MSAEPTIGPRRPARHAVGTLAPDDSFTLAIGFPVRYRPGSLTDLQNGAPWFGTLALNARFDRALDVALTANGWERSGPWDLLDGGARLSAPVLRIAERERRDAAAAQFEREGAADRFTQRLVAVAAVWVAALVVAVDLSRGADSDVLRTGREFFGTTWRLLQWLWASATPGTALVGSAVLAYAVAYAAAVGQPQRRGLAVAGLVVGSLAAAGYAIRSAIIG